MDNSKNLSTLQSISESLKILSTPSSIFQQVIELFISILPVFLGAFLAYKFAIKQIPKQEESAQRSKILWLACHESWIPLCELTEQLIDLFSKDYIDISLFRTDWENEQFLENNLSSEVPSLSKLFIYLKASKRGQISPVLDNIKQIKSITSQYNIASKKQLDILYGKIDSLVLKKLCCCLSGDLDNVSYDNHDTLEHNFYNSLLNTSSLSNPWYMHIAGVTYGVSDDYCPKATDFATNCWDELTQIEAYHETIDEFVCDPDLKIHIYKTQQLYDMRDEINTLVTNQINAFSSSSNTVKKEILTNLKAIQKIMYTKIDSLYGSINQ